MRDAEMKHDCTLNNRTECQTALTSVKQHTSLKLDLLPTEDKREANQALKSAN